MYLYETHLHTAPISACADAGLRESLEFYKSAGYAGVFITNHFLDGNISESVRDLPYDERIEFYFSACEEGKRIGEEIGLPVFTGIESTYKGTDFLIYGIDKEYCLNHQDMDKMRKSELLRTLMDDGALIIHAHPFREAWFIDHFRLYPNFVHGVEIFNAARKEFENGAAAEYCKYFNLIRFAGSDNHKGGRRTLFGGMATDTPIANEREFIDFVLSGKAKPFKKDENGTVLL
ncbi:MAG: histidinol-phosphatase [Ruminococcaceae bacterium]|nr:histidinol-phosphatase [Oscillospiraceae bacterium]